MYTKNSKEVVTIAGKLMFSSTNAMEVLNTNDRNYYPASHYLTNMGRREAFAETLEVLTGISADYWLDKVGTIHITGDDSLLSAGTRLIKQVN